MAQKLITFARELGSGGEEVARRVAERLGIPLLDREIISRAASLAGVSEETILEAEKVPSFLNRMIELLGRYPVAAELVGPTTDLPPVPPLSTEQYRSLIEDVIRGIAARGDALILGHAGQMALKDVRGILRVYVCAPWHLRLARIMGAENLDRQAAEKRLKSNDKQLAEFYQAHYRVNWQAPHLYDLILNTERFTPEEAAEVVLRAAAALGR